MALLDPETEGPNRSLMVQLPGEGTDSPVQVSRLMRKSSAWLPMTEALVTSSGSPPEGFDTVIA